MKVNVFTKHSDRIAENYSGVSRISIDGDGGGINIDFQDDRTGVSWAVSEQKMVEVLDEGVDGHFTELEEIDE